MNKFSVERFYFLVCTVNKVSLDNFCCSCPWNVVKHMSGQDKLLFPKIIEELLVQLFSLAAAHTNGREIKL
jgi:hypothetical protein